MKKIFLITLLIVSCKNEQPIPLASNYDSLYDVYNEKYSSKELLKLDSIINTTSIEHNISDLSKLNRKLIKENIKLKDSINTINIELMTYKKPKKRNFFQRLFNVAPDSIFFDSIVNEPVLIDTIN